MTLSTAIDVGAVSRVVGIKTEFVNLHGGEVVNLPQRIAIFAQGNSAATYALTKRRVTSAVAVAERFGHGSPLHMAVSEVLPPHGGGVGTLPVTIYPLADAENSAASTCAITPVGTATKAGVARVAISGYRSLPIAVTVGDTVATVATKVTAATNGILGMPMLGVATTTLVNLTSKWKGTTANDITVRVTGAEDTGITFVVTQPTGGSINPDLATAIAQMGDVWETMILNGMGIDDADALDLLETEGVSRASPTRRKNFCGVFVGNTTVDVAEATTVSGSRPLDFINSQLVAPGSDNHPLAVAAAQLAGIAVLANNNPPHDYGHTSARSLTPGTDGEQWTYLERELAVLAGSSTVQVRDGVIDISDVVTFFAPAGVPLPAHRFVVDQVKIANIVFNFDLLFANAAWDGAPLIPDDQPTTNRRAKKALMAVAAAGTLLDALGLAAIVSDPASAKANTRAAIDSQNPKRLNFVTNLYVSGNANVFALDVNWGFNLGQAELV